MLLVAGLLACNSRSDKNSGQTPGPPPDQSLREENSTGLRLNNGAKWKADSTTLSNVALLKGIVSAAKEEGRGGYIQTANQLQDGLNKMIRECKMKGADHDALHLWLEPLIEKTKELKQITSAKNAAVILNEIKKQVNLFEQYFE